MRWRKTFKNSPQNSKIVHAGAYTSLGFTNPIFGTYMCWNEFSNIRRKNLKLSTLGLIFWYAFQIPYLHCQCDQLKLLKLGLQIWGRPSWCSFFDPAAMLFKSHTLNIKAIKRSFQKFGTIIYNVGIYFAMPFRSYIWNVNVIKWNFQKLTTKATFIHHGAPISLCFSDRKFCPWI